VFAATSFHKDSKNRPNAQRLSQDIAELRKNSN